MSADIFQDLQDKNKKTQDQCSIHKYAALAQELLEKRLKRGDHVIDGTMGNGLDTCFLWRQVCPGGQVYAFDVQLAAIEKTRKHLSEAGYLRQHEEISLINDCHSRLAHYLPRTVNAAMFNLGYLPGGTKDTTTSWNSLQPALQSLIRGGLIESSGLISIMSYSGHMGGAEERQKLLEYVRHLEEPEWHVTEITKINAGRSQSPILIIIQRN
ncbi:class I SAM-dependent methyltransferase [Anoxynatronum buryatiense]|uniref:rRNA methylase n=1 Tax=Anoxynatronum buryatiense TaxID=489973 RepID=A0AA45WUG0_9CLOT|nr:class I SAM-dependent methyltransferase [Anoxynatronum buryatiense]SMP47867.1 Putative rRNA methylase [Anoxynatronum buryatiense]